MKRIQRKAANLSTLLFTCTLISACGQNQAPSSNLGEMGDIAKIIGGTDATGNEPFAKHIVGLYDAKIGAICTASILSENILVTAAHCVESEPAALRVVFGRDFDSKDLIVLGVESYQVSPVWAFRQMMEKNTGDIALVKFTGGLPPGYEPAVFLTDAKMLSNSQTVLLAGYGTSVVTPTKDPRTGQIVGDHSESGKLRSVSTTIKNATFSVSEFSTESSKGKSACHGDSGGPAYVEIESEVSGVKSKKLVLAGVTSRSDGDAFDMCNVAAVYTSISFYATWIVDTSKRLNETVAPKVPATVANFASASGF